MDAETKIHMTRAKLLAAQGRIRAVGGSRLESALINKMLEILGVIAETHRQMGGIFDADWRFLNGVDRYLREEIHDVDSLE